MSSGCVACAVISQFSHQFISNTNSKVCVNSSYSMTLSHIFILVGLLRLLVSYSPLLSLHCGFCVVNDRNIIEKPQV